MQSLCRQPAVLSCLMAMCISWACVLGLALGCCQHVLAACCLSAACLQQVYLEKLNNGQTTTPWIGIGATIVQSSRIRFPPCCMQQVFDRQRRSASGGGGLVCEPVYVRALLPSAVAWILSRSRCEAVAAFTQPCIAALATAFTAAETQLAQH